MSLFLCKISLIFVFETSKYGMYKFVSKTTDILFQTKFMAGHVLFPLKSLYYFYIWLQNIVYKFRRKTTVILFQAKFLYIRGRMHFSPKLKRIYIYIYIYIYLSYLDLRHLNMPCTSFRGKTMIFILDKIIG